MKNQDVPGVIGHVGTVLGQNRINIANFSLGRRDAPPAPGEPLEAVAVVSTDELVPGIRAGAVARESGGPVRAVGRVQTVSGSGGRPLSCGASLCTGARCQWHRRTTSAAIDAERHDPIHGARFDCLGGHPEDDATGFILSDIEGPGLLHLQHSLGAVVAHPGHDDADHVPPAVARRRTEQHIDRRTMPAHQRPVPHFHEIAGAAALQQQMAVSGCDQRLSPNHRVVVGGLFHGDAADLVQPVAQSGR